MKSTFSICAVFFILIFGGCTLESSDRSLTLGEEIVVRAEFPSFGFLQENGRLILDLAVTDCRQEKEGVYLLSGYPINRYLLSNDPSFPEEKSTNGFVLDSELVAYRLEIYNRIITKIPEINDGIDASGMLDEILTGSPLKKRFMPHREYSKLIPFIPVDGWSVK